MICMCSETYYTQHIGTPYSCSHFSLPFTFSIFFDVAIKGNVQMFIKASEDCRLISIHKI